MSLGRGLPMRKLVKYMGIVILVLFLGLIYMFPLCGKDLYWALVNFNSLGEALHITRGSIIAGSILLYLAKNHIMKVIFSTLVVGSLFVLLKKLVNSKNYSIPFLALFFFLLIDKKLFASSFVSITGFIFEFLSSLLLILLICLLVNDTIKKVPIPILFIMGFVVANGNIAIGFTSLVLVLTFIYKNRKSFNKYRACSLLLGITMGLIAIAEFAKLNYTSISYNLIHALAPFAVGPNFIITIVLSGLLFLFAIKTYNKGKRIGALVSIIGISFYLFTSVLSTWDILKYLAFVVNFIASYYILKNATNNKAFKNRVDYYYLSKLFYTLVISVVGEITIASTLLLTLFDIILILEIYNYLFPKNYLRTTWEIAAIFMLVTNIYVYEVVLARHESMKTFIENKLECSTQPLVVPERFETEYLYENIPSSTDELDWFIEYYGIDLYTK